MTPLVSVIIPTYNRCELLAEALDSVLAQTHENLEVIVVDDGSTDGTGEYVRGLGSDRIRYVFQENSGRPASARNAGLKLAQGDFVAFLDSDDKWDPAKVETQLRVFEVNQDFDLIATDFVELPPRPGSETVLKLRQPEIITYRELLRFCPIQNSSVMLRSSVVAEIGLLDEDPEVRALEDYEYWLRVLRRRDRPAVILAEPLTLYRRHEGNIGIQDVAQAERSIAIVERHRDSDPAYVDSVIKDLRRMKAYRQAQVDLDRGEVSLPAAVVRRDLRFGDRLRLLRRALLSR